MGRGPEAATIPRCRGYPWLYVRCALGTPHARPSCGRPWRGKYHLMEFMQVRSPIWHNGASPYVVGSACVLPELNTCHPIAPACSRFAGFAGCELAPFNTGRLPPTTRWPASHPVAPRIAGLQARRAALGRAVSGAGQQADRPPAQPRGTGPTRSSRSWMPPAPRCPSTTSWRHSAEPCAAMRPATWESIWPI